jgi:hypothetical protein
MIGMFESVNIAVIAVYNKEMSPPEIAGQGGVLGKFIYTAGCLAAALLAVNLPELNSGKK